MKLTETRPTAPRRRHNPLKSWGPPLLAACCLAACCFQAKAQTYNLSNTWALAGVTQNLDASANNRGMCYYAASNEVIVNNKGATHLIEIYDGTLGTSNGFVNNSGLSLGNFTLNKIGFASDGILYGANLNTTVSGSSPYKLYSWTNLSVAPYNCYATTSGDALGTFTAAAGSKRLGDTWAITGGGTNTLILAGMASTNAFALFYTTDGVNFTPTIITVPLAQLPAPGSGVQFGLCFYTNNTFLINPNASGGSGNLYLVQFPANYETAASPLTATVLATNAGLSGDWLDLSYSASAGLLATHGNGTSPSFINLYSLPATNFSGMALLATTNLSFPTSISINGNETGDIALGGAGYSNAVYTLDTSAGLQASVILFTAAPISPSISAEPVGGAAFTNVGSFTFSVGATGTQPLSYLWQYNTVSNLATAADISGATNSTYTISPLTTNASGWYDVIVSNVGGVTSSIPAQLTVYVPSASSSFTNLWNLAPGSRPYLGGLDTYDTRGLAFDTNTMTLLVADKNGSETGIFVISATNGSDLFALNTIGIGVSGDQFPLDQVGVGDDGVVYACNLYDTGSSAGTFAIFSWSSVTNTVAPQFAYGPGDPSAPGIQDRWGDTMAVRGTGVNTEILLGSYYGFLSGPSTNAVLLTTTDGSTFTSTALSITNAAGVPAGFCGLGICFGVGNTFWSKSPAYDLREIAFDPATGNCNVLLDLPAGASGNSSFNSMSAICLDPVNNILTGITFNDVPNDLAVYQLYGAPAATLAIPPLLVDQAFFPSNIGNSQDNGVTIIKAPCIFGLDVNNGITALTYVPPPGPRLPPFSITAIANQAGTGVTLTWQSYAGVNYQVESTGAFRETNTVWTPLGPPVTATNTTASATDSNPSGAARFYQVVIP